MKVSAVQCLMVYLSSIAAWHVTPWVLNERSIDQVESEIRRIEPYQQALRDINALEVNVRAGEIRAGAGYVVSLNPPQRSTDAQSI